MVGGLRHAAREAVAEKQYTKSGDIGLARALEESYQDLGVNEFDTCPEADEALYEWTSYDKEIAHAGKDGCMQMCRLILEEREESDG